MQDRDYRPLRVSGTVRLDRARKVYRARLRISDPTRVCHYRDRRITLGGAWLGRAADCPPGLLTKRSAREALDALLVAERWNEGARREQRATVADGAARLIRQMEADRAVLKTITDRQSIIDRRVLPKFGTRKLADLTSGELADWRDELLHEGLSPRTVRRHLGIVHAICARAVAAGELDRNPVDAVRSP